MVSSRLEILGEDYPIVIDIPISITFQQADVREPDKRNASQSKTIRLYGTNSTNLLFENLFDVNIATQTFNPNKKSQCIYFVDEIPQFRGDLQLTKITIEPNTNIVYDCNIVGNEGNVFIDIGEKLLSQLDFSEYDHTYNRTNIIDSWDNYVPGTGYYYPFVDNGKNGGSFNNFKVEQFIPCFSAYEYLDKILTDAGYEWSGAFLNGAEFKHNIIYPNVINPVLSSSQVDARQAYVGLNSNITPTVASINILTQGLLDSTATPITFNNESTPFFDGSPAIHTSGVITIPDNGSYNVATVLKTRLTVTVADAVTFAGTRVYTVRYGYKVIPIIEKSTDGGTTWFGLVAPLINHSDQQDSDGTLLFKYIDDTTGIFTVDYESGASTGAITLSQGDKIRVKHVVLFDAIYSYYLTAAPSVLFSYTPDSVEHLLLSGASGSSFYSLVGSTELFAGAIVEANTCLPTTIKQKDFLKWIMQMYNLFIDVDKTNPKSLVIEPYYTYFNLGSGGTSIVNWENKIDRDKPFEVNPLFLLEGRNYEYTYKEDKDFYNQKYIKNKGEIFGYHKVTIDNDFLSQTKKNEIGFSPTPNVDNPVIGAVYPRIYDVDDNGIKTIANNIRILYANPTTSTNNYNFEDSSLGTTIQTNKIGYAGHTDNPFNPTIDLNFYFPKEVYYTYPDLSFTTGNLFNKYHKSYLENITGRDSRTIIANLWLTPIDIYEFTFRKKYFIDGAYYLVNKIVDYNPYVQKSTKVELIKLIDVNVFTPSKYPIITLGAIDRDYGTIKPTRPDGTNINYSDTSIQWGGLNTFISADSERVFLTNCENVQVIGVSDFVGVGLKNVTIDSTYNGKQLVNSVSGVNLQRTSVTVTSAELLAMNTTPITILPYNGTNKRIMYIDVEVLDASPFTAYTTGSQITLKFNTTSSEFARMTAILNATAPTILTPTYPSGSAYVNGEDLVLTSSGAPSGGTFDIKINLTYYEI
jgi:hypothetical protein